MSDETITVANVEIDAQEVLDAAEELLTEDENNVEGSYVGDTVAFKDDGDRDTAVYVVAEGGRISTYKWLDSLRDEAQEALKSDVPHIRFEHDYEPYGCEIPIDADFAILEGPRSDDKMVVNYKIEDDRSDLDGWEDMSHSDVKEVKDGFDEGAVVDKGETEIVQ